MASGEGFGDLSMFELFRMEVESQAIVLNQSLLDIENDPGSAPVLESMMRAAHSLKGAAKMVGVDAVVQLAHVMEDCFVAAQHGELRLGRMHIDSLLRAVDLVERIARLQEAEAVNWGATSQEALTAALDDLRRVCDPSSTCSAEASPVVEFPEPVEQERAAPAASDAADARSLRVSAERMSRMLGMAGEILVENRWLQTHAGALRRLKRKQDELAADFDRVRAIVAQSRKPEESELVKNMQQKLEQNRRALGEQLASLDDYERRGTQLSSRLYNEVNGSRMRPFATVVSGFRRMVRDLARDLGKDVDLELVGADTPVDRDVLEKLQAPLTHLLRNAVDHGIESPEQRALAGKPLRATVRLEASHGGGMLRVSVKDNGGGINLVRLREKVLQKGLMTRGLHHELSDDELIEFLFLPDFSTRDNVTAVSGRGVGLDVVRDLVRELGGTVAVRNTEGKGVEFLLQLPLSLSIMSAVIVDIGGESYALPLARIDHLLSVDPRSLGEINGGHYLSLDNRQIGLVSGTRVLGCEAVPQHRDALDVVVVSDRLGTFGIVVDRIVGQRQLSVQPLDPRLGKVKDLSASALLEDGSPTLILDVDDLVRSIDHLVRGEQPQSVLPANADAERTPARRVLVVEDSLTVREVERELLQSQGYQVATAVDGMDGWNAVRQADYDLVITDIDMPRMDGIALLKAIRQDLHLRHLPVMIVSYKDRKEDRQRGLDAGADYYLAKSSFHDDRFIEAVIDLIGEALP